MAPRPSGRGRPREHHREQHLGGADVAGGLLRPDVLLTGLQGQTVGRRAVGVDGDSDQSAGQVALEPGPYREKSGMGGPPNLSGTPKRWDEPTTSAPISRAPEEGPVRADPPRR